MKFRDFFKYLTRGDKVLILFLSISTGASFPLLNAYSKQGELGVIEVNGKVVSKVSLKEKKVYPVKGYRYDTAIAVKNGTIEIRDGLCPNPLLHSGEISRTGEIRVCVYNRTVIRIEGEDSRGVDVISK